MKPLNDLPEDFSTGVVERAVLRYLHENDGREAGHSRYEVVRIDRFASADGDATGTFFTAVVKELLLMPQERKEEFTRWGVLLATFQEDGSFKVSAPLMSAHLS